MKKNKYITTAIAYTNGAPHLGHALEMIQADAIARFWRQEGHSVQFLTGTDEHGTKIQRAAVSAGIPTQEFVDGIATQFRELAEDLELSNTDFIRTTDRERHWPAVIKLWNILAESGDLYRKSYEGAYCVGHEAFIKPSELVDGVCPIHKTSPERIQEENWFFRLTKYKDDVRRRIASDELRIVPEARKNEVLNLFEDAEDVSFSRPAKDLSWGIPVPGDASQTMYVWADALTNYISAIGYAQEGEQFQETWPADIHLIGKDILRFHAMIWPAMLLAAGIALPKAIFVHGFITANGEKMSKSLGNVVNPADLVRRYGADVARYFLLREVPSHDDGDFSWNNLDSRYVSDLANGLGNLVQRIATLVATKLGGAVEAPPENMPELPGFFDLSAYRAAFEGFRLHDALADTWAKIAQVNAYLNEQQPWKQEGDTRQRTLSVAATAVAHIAWRIQPFMPEAAGKICALYGVPCAEHLAGGQAIVVGSPQALFPRREG